jgi:hypothetical protein
MNRRQAAAPWLSAVIVVGLVNAAFVLLGIWVATLPREPLKQRVTDAFAVPLSMGWGALAWQLIASAGGRPLPAARVAAGQVHHHQP